jgi:hypothetical protein
MAIKLVIEKFGIYYSASLRQLFKMRIILMQNDKKKGRVLSFSGCLFIISSIGYLNRIKKYFFYFSCNSLPTEKASPSLSPIL